MRITISLLLALLGLSLVQFVSAQRSNPVRVELNANLDMEDYNLVPCGEKGILVFFESETKGSTLDTRIWHFALYNKELQQQWLADTALIDGAKFRGHVSDERHSYLFFLDSDRIRSASNMQIVIVDYTVNTFQVLDMSVPEKSEPLEFGMANGKVVVPFNNSSYEPDISFIDLTTGMVNTIRPELEGLNIIQDLSVQGAGGDIFLVVDNYLGKKQNALMILELSSEGATKQKLTLNPAIEGKVLNEARVFEAGRDTLLVLGTYHGDPARLRSTSDETGPGSAGYFVARFVNSNQDIINYYNFLEFEEMYRSLSSKTVADLRRKAEKQKNRGAEYSLDYTLLLHNIIPYNDNYVLLSEAYYPEYRTVTNMYYDYYGRPIPQTYTVFDGYKYISGIAAAFTPSGEMLWDNGIEMPDILTFNLAKYIGSFVSGEELAFFYSNQNKIFYKITGGNSEGGPTQSIQLESKYKGDKVMEDLESKMIHWYGNYFLCYGYQQVKNNRLAESKRTIFFFSKLAFN